MRTPTPILLTGATGYVGGRLLKILERDGHRVRCLVRRPAYMEGKAAPNTEVVRGDLLKPETLQPAMKSIHTAYYLVHSMGDSETFEESERQGALNFAAAARASGVRRIIYLGGLGDPDENLSPHLRSRHTVGRILRDSGVETLEFRASIVIGSGSLSFEMVRDLVEKLPVMITPRWVSVPAQPIGVTDLLEYLRQGLTLEAEGSRVIEIGGEDRVSYGDLMREYARRRGLKRWMIPVPVLTPRLSSLWLGLVTPLYARVGRKLIDSICHPTVVRDDSAWRLFDIRPLGFRAALSQALRNEDRQFAATRWSDALSSGGTTRNWGGARFGKRLVDSRAVTVPLSPEAAFLPIRRIGGRNGWYYANFLWRVRGFIDLLLGGVGLRRGRRTPEQPAVGEALDWWRIEAYKPNRLLRLSAEMKAPGRAWLQFEVSPGDHGSTIRQTAIFDPVGLSGLAYWYLIYPLHSLVFAGMLRQIGRTAVREAKRPPSESSAGPVADEASS